MSHLPQQNFNRSCTSIRKLIYYNWGKHRHQRIYEYQWFSRKTYGMCFLQNSTYEKWYYGNTVPELTYFTFKTAFTSSPWWYGSFLLLFIMDLEKLFRDLIFLCLFSLFLFFIFSPFKSYATPVSLTISFSAVAKT